MSKKNFSSKFDELLEPTTDNKELQNSKPKIEKNTPDKIIRTTILLKESSYAKIKAIAYWERKQIKDLINVAIDEIINSFDHNKLNEILEEYEKRL